MTFKEFLRLAYGLFMGTSVQYLKPSQRFLWPTKVRRVDAGLSLFFGGSGVCGVLHGADTTWLINTNQGEAARELERYVTTLGASLDTTLAATTDAARVDVVINTSLYPDFTGGNVLYQNARTLVPHADTEFLFRQLGGRPKRMESVRVETVFEFAGETIRLVPIGRASSPSDLVIWLERREILFAGGLFYNRIHPPLHGGLQVDIDAWIQAIEGLLSRFRPKFIVPAEGDLGTIADVREFAEYLRTLRDPSVEFQDCRKKFDWTEIPSYTSLEENFDLVRERVKTHTTF